MGKSLLRYLDAITTSEPPKPGLVVKWEGGGAAQRFLASNSSLPEHGPGWGSKKGSTRSLWKRKNKVKSVFFSEKPCLE